MYSHLIPHIILMHIRHFLTTPSKLNYKQKLLTVSFIEAKSLKKKIKQQILLNH